MCGVRHAGAAEQPAGDAAAGQRRGAAAGRWRGPATRALAAVEHAAARRYGGAAPPGDRGAAAGRARGRAAVARHAPGRHALARALPAQPSLRQPSPRRAGCPRSVTCLLDSCPHGVMLRSQHRQAFPARQCMRRTGVWSGDAHAARAVPCHRGHPRRPALRPWQWASVWSGVEWQCVRSPGRARAGAGPAACWSGARGRCCQAGSWRWRRWTRPPARPRTTRTPRPRSSGSRCGQRPPAPCAGLWC